jgi:hypothetical protein
VSASDVQDLLKQLQKTELQLAAAQAALDEIYAGRFPALAQEAANSTALAAERARCLWYFNAQHRILADYDCRQGLADGSPIPAWYVPEAP